MKAAKRPINQRAVLLREAVGTIVPMLAGKKVKVQQRGMVAKVEYDTKTHQPTVVVLPYMPDDASDELVDAVQGFLDHEVAHILFTDVSTLVESHKDETLQGLTNALEDTYIERRMRKMYTGSAFNLSNTGKFFCDQVIEPSFKVASNSGNTEDMVATLMPCAIRAWAGQWEFAEFMSDKWHHMSAVKDQIGDDLIDEISGISCSQDSLDLARRIIERMGQPPKPPEPPKSSKPKSSPEEEKESEGEGAPDSQDGEGEGDQPESNSGDSDSGEEGDGESSSEVSSEEGDEDAPPSSSESNPKPVSSKKALSKLNYDEDLGKAITELASKEASTSEYLVYTTEHDTVSTIQPGSNAMSQVAALQDLVDGMIGTMSKDLERAVAARSAAVWLGGQTRGRLDSRSLHRVKFDHVDVFKKRQISKTKDVAVSLVLDLSGSMCTNSKLDTACYSGYGLSSTLERLGIKNEVIGFTTNELTGSQEKAQASDPMAEAYSRRESIRMSVLKGFDEAMTSVTRARFSQVMLDRDCNSNVDGESVLTAYRRLAKRRETRKVMIVLSDGRPAVYGGQGLEGHLKRVVEMIEASGTDVMGIGIMDQSVKKFYKRHAVISKVSDLPQLVMGELKKSLLQ